MSLFLFPLFLIVTGLFFFLGFLLTRPGLRFAAWGAFCLLFAGLSLGWLESMGVPKDVRLERFCLKTEVRVVAGEVREGEGIYVWVDDPACGDRMYRMPYDGKAAEALQQGLEKRGRGENGGLTMRSPLEPSFDREKPPFHELPQPALPDKGGEPPPPPEVEA